MAGDGSLADRLRTTAIVWIDAVVYALVVAAAATVGGLVVAVATGGGLPRAKALLFLAGFALMAYATVRLWPSTPADLENEREFRRDPTGSTIPESPDQTRFQSFVRALPPLRWLPAPAPTRRMVPAGKLLLGSVFVLLTSYLMEAVFGI